MTQTKFESFCEANTNTGVGLIINLGLSFVVYPLLDMADPIEDWWKFFVVTTIFTVTAVARSYIIRRIYTGRTQDLRLIVRDGERINHG